MPLETDLPAPVSTPTSTPPTPERKPGFSWKFVATSVFIGFLILLIVRVVILNWGVTNEFKRSGVDTLVAYNCGDFSLQLDYHFVPQNPEVGPGDAGYYEFDYLKGGETRIIDDGRGGRKFFSRGGFQSVLRPIKYMIFGDTGNGSDELNWTLAPRTGGPSRSGGWNIVVSQDDFSPDEFDVISACLSDHIAVMSESRPVSSIAYVKVPPVLLPYDKAQESFSCPDAAHTIIELGYQSEYVSERFQDTSGGSVFLTVGYINNNQEFQPADIKKIEAQLPNEDRLAELNSGYPKVSEKLAAQKAFQSKMAALLPSCVNADGDPFTKFYPFATTSTQ